MGELVLLPTRWIVDNLLDGKFNLAKDHFGRKIREGKVIIFCSCSLTGGLYEQREKYKALLRQFGYRMEKEAALWIKNKIAVLENLVGE